MNNTKHTFIEINQGISRSILHLKKIIKMYKDQNLVFVVLSPSHYLVIPLRILWRGKIVLDAGWPLTDGTLSRNFGVLKYLKWIKTILIDFFAFQMASVIILETKSQKKRISREFHLKAKKINVLFTGFDENSYAVPGIKPIEFERIDERKPTVLFRGSYNPESGLDILSEISHSQNAKEFNLVICSNSDALIRQFSERAILITRKLDISEIRWIYETSAVVIGQISNSKRLDLTIPHKAFEAGYFGKPYISSDRSGIREMYDSETQIAYLKHSSRSEVLNKIELILYDQEYARALGNNMQMQYKKMASQEMLSKKLLLILHGAQTL
jgi:glycosyltransferase involved in cell wall biosynthesis